MPESVLLASERAEEELHELRRKFHPHHDHLNLIVPSAWFLIGVTIAEFYFYKAHHLVSVLTRLRNVEPFAETASPSLQFFLALSLFIAAFTAIYVIGQMINGFSALILDRAIVKKLLTYPFSLYERRLRVPHAKSSQILRQAMLDASYTIFCVNLVPLTFLEIVMFLFATRVHSFKDWLTFHWYAPLVVLPLLLYLHFGHPSLRKPKRYTVDATDADLSAYARYFRYHLYFLLAMFTLLFWLAQVQGHIGAIVILPLTNIVIGLLEPAKAEPPGITPVTDSTRLYTYAKACFTNPIYMAAKMTGYGEVPSASLIRQVRTGIGADTDEGEFFWMSYLLVQHRGTGSNQTMYHFLAMYGMVRNLCNSTAFVLMFSVSVFWAEWPEHHGHGVAVWSISLCLLMYALFMRYLYVYGAYFSKYVLRAAAYLLRGSNVVIRP